MTRIPEVERQEFNLLMMAAVDEELAAPDKEQFEWYLNQYPECRLDFDRYTRIKEVATNMQFTSPPEEIWERYWLRVYNRIERGVAWVLLSIGATILLGYGFYKAVESIIVDPEIALLLRIGLLAGLAGAAILIVSVVREKILTSRTDRYQREIQR
jgi:hypothetical protein